MTLRPCLSCGTPAAATYCEEHGGNRHHGPHTGSRQARGYDAIWDRLSARARRLQPFCTDCGAVERLSLDHLPSAWRRRAQGKPLRLGLDVEVVCLRCNSRRGAARGPGGMPLPGGVPDRRGSREDRHSRPVVEG